MPRKKYSFSIFRSWLLNLICFQEQTFRKLSHFDFIEVSISEELDLEPSFILAAII